MPRVYVLLFSNQSGAARKIYNKHYKSKQIIEDIDLPTFALSALANATENFSTKNKLREGGFGPVYKVMKKMVSGTSIFLKTFLTLAEDYFTGHTYGWESVSSEKAFKEVNTRVG